MIGNVEQNPFSSWCVKHPFTLEDRKAMTAMRVMVEPNKGRMQGTAARVPYDAIMNRVAAPAGVAYETDTVGGIAGWWCRPENARTDSAILICTVAGLTGVRLRPFDTSSVTLQPARALQPSFLTIDWRRSMPSQPQSTMPRPAIAGW